MYMLFMAAITAIHVLAGGAEPQRCSSDNYGNTT